MLPTLAIDIQNITFSYENHMLFEHFDLTVAEGQITCLLGPSGVGKSTLLRLIAGITPHYGLQVTTGSITGNQGHSLHSHVTYHPQTDSLLPWFSALDNALLGAKLRGHVTSEHKKRAEQLFEEMGLSHALPLKPHALSMGMRQRVALIRTFLENKPVILMDEPFANVDTVTRFELQTLTAQLLKNKTVLLVTHDPLEALRLGDSIRILGGRPARIIHSFQFDIPIPRDVTQVSIVQHQAELIQALIYAKELMT